MGRFFLTPINSTFQHEECVLQFNSDTNYLELASVTGLRVQFHKTAFSSDANYKYQVTERLAVNWGSHNPILRFDGSPNWLTAQNSTVLTVTGLL